MNYTTDRKLFERRCQDILEETGGRRVWIGIGAWRLDLAETTDRIGWLFRRQVPGVLLFSQGGLRNKPNSFPVLRAAFTGERLQQ